MDPKNLSTWIVCGVLALFALGVSLARVGAGESAPEPLELTYRAGRIANFALRYCNSPACVSIQAKDAFVALDGTSVSAANATIEIRTSGSKKIQCHDFSFDIEDQFVVCDNRALQQAPSYTIGSNLEVHSY